MASVFANFVMMMAIFVYSQKLIYIRFNLLAVLLPVIVYGLLYFLNFYLLFIKQYSLISISFTLICSLLFVILYIKLFCPMSWNKFTTKISHGIRLLLKVISAK